MFFMIKLNVTLSTINITLLSAIWRQWLSPMRRLFRSTCLTKCWPPYALRPLLSHAQTTDANKYIILHLHAENLFCLKIRISHPTLLMSSAPAAISTDSALVPWLILSSFMAPVVGQTFHQTSSSATSLCSPAGPTTLNPLQYTDVSDAAGAALPLTHRSSKHQDIVVAHCNCDSLIGSVKKKSSKMGTHRKIG